MLTIAMLLAALRRGASLNPERLKHVPKGWQVAAPSAADADVVEQRQLGHPANMVGVPAVSLCRHGYPQAVLQDPGAHKFGAGMLRLTCPHLCEAVDAWEAEGAVRALSAELLAEDANRDALRKVNERHAVTRKSMVQGEALARAEARLGADTVRRPSTQASRASLRQNWTTSNVCMPSSPTNCCRGTTPSGRRCSKDWRRAALTRLDLKNVESSAPAALMAGGTRHARTSRSCGRRARGTRSCASYRWPGTRRRSGRAGRSSPGWRRPWR
ncbi:unnamed protein product, partial [Pelagomonas calceolata]